MTLILFLTINFYYIAFLKKARRMLVNHYISQSYLYAVASNVGYLKRFYGL
jgi:hypothetical protein